MNTSQFENLFSEQWTWSLRSILVLIACSLITILTILGNGLVLISVKYRFHARSYSDYFIISLCLADFFVGLFVMPFMTLHSVHLRWPFEYQLCYIWMSIDFTCSTASFLTLAAMALDRYYALTAPYFHLRNRSYSSVIMCIIASWLIPFLIWPSSILIGYYFNTYSPSCVHPARPIVIVILCTIFYYIPLLFMLICYSKIIVNIKNIEVMIKGTWGMCKFDDMIDTKSPRHSSDSSLRSLISRYLHRNTHDINKKELLSTSVYPPRTNRQTTTATFTGQKRCLVECQETKRLKHEHDDESLVRARLNSRTSSIPAARCINYFYYQNQLPCQLKFSDEQMKLNSMTHERSRSQSHSSSQGNGNAGLGTTDISDHSSSFENNFDDEHRRLNRRQQQSIVSTSFHSSRYSQRAIAKFMQERNKARLRRNQKASRMLGILLAVFLICWLPFTISYPTMVLLPDKFPRQLESVVFWLGYANSLLNPFLYVYSSRNFRQAILDTLCCFTRIRSRQNHLRYRWSFRR